VLSHKLKGVLGNIAYIFKGKLLGFPCQVTLGNSNSQPS